MNRQRRVWEVAAVASLAALVMWGCGGGGDGDGTGEVSFVIEDQGAGESGVPSGDVVGQDWPGTPLGEVTPDEGDCTPHCAGKECGGDGCGGVCGSCYNFSGGVDDSLCQANGTCAADVACSCGSKKCGVDDCGNSCGVCKSGAVCSDQGLCTAPTAPCDVQGFASIEQYAKLEPGDNGFTLYYHNINGDQYPIDAIVIELDNQPPATGPTGPGVYDLAFTSFATPGLFLYVLEGYVDGAANKILVPTSGQITIKSMSPDGGTFDALVEGAVLSEGTINQDNGEVTIVPGGLTWCLDKLILNTPLLVKQPFCVEQGSGVSIGDNIADFALQDCNGNWVNLHEACGKAKAMWIVLVAGW